MQTRSARLDLLIPSTRVDLNDRMGITLYLRSFSLSLTFARTARPTAVANFGGRGRPSSVQMNRADMMFVDQLGLKTLK